MHREIHVASTCSVGQPVEDLRNVNWVWRTDAHWAHWTDAQWTDTGPMLIGCGGPMLKDDKDAQR